MLLLMAHGYRDAVRSSTYDPWKQSRAKSKDEVMGYDAERRR